MFGSQSFFLLLAVFVTLVSVTFSGVIVPREISEDAPEAQDGPSGAEPEDSNELADEGEKDSSLLGRRRGPSYDHPWMSGHKPFRGVGFGSEARPPLRPNDYEFPDYGRPEVGSDYDYDRRNPDKGIEKGRGRPFGGSRPNERPRIPGGDKGRDRPFGGKGDDEVPPIPGDDKSRGRPFGGKGDDEEPPIPGDEKGTEQPFGGKDDNEGKDGKGFDEDIDKEIDEKEDKDEKGVDEGTNHEEGKDDKGPGSEEEEKHNEEEDEKPDLKGEEDNDGDKEPDEKDEKPSDEDKDHPPEEEDKGVDEVETGIEQDEEKDTDEKTGEEGGYQPFSGGDALDTPFFNVRQVNKYFQQLEKALEQVFRQSMEEASLLNGTYANTTDEEVDVNGQKYMVHKSIIKSGDKDRSIFVEAISSVPESNDTKVAMMDKFKEKKLKID